MPLVSDNFNRADGPLGEAWTWSNNVFSVVSNRMVNSAGGTAYLTGLTAPGSASATATVPVCTTTAAMVAPAIKLRNDGDQGVCGYAYYNGTAVSYRIQEFTGSGGVQRANKDIVQANPGTVTLRIEYASGVYRLYADGVSQCTWSSTAFGSNQKVGVKFQQNVTWADDFEAIGDGQPFLMVTPSRIGTENGPTPVTFLLVGLTWASLPSIGVNAGGLSGQTYQNNTTVTAIFTPPAAPQTVTALDDDTGLSVPISVVEGVGADSGGSIIGAGGWPNAGWIAITNRTGLDTPDSRVLTTDTIIEGGPPELPDETVLTALADLLTGFYVYHIPGMTLTLGSAIDKLWYAVNGRLDLEEGTYPNQPVQPINATLGDLLLKWYNTETAEYITAQDILEAVGEPAPPDLSSVRGDIGISTQETWISLVDMLNAIYGQGSASVNGISTSLTDVRTNQGYTLASVKAWIDAIPSADVSAVLTALNNHDTHLTNATSDIRDDIAAAVILLGALQLGVDGVADVVGVIDGTLTTVNGKLDAISAKLDHLSGAPIWPGIDGVELLDPIAVTNAYTFTGTCDGILLSIQQELVKQPTMKIGTISTYRTMGRVAFVSDSGEIEPWQPIPGSACVMMPKQMTHAGGFIIGFYHTVDATVVPWTIKASS